MIRLLSIDPGNTSGRALFVGCSLFFAEALPFERCLQFSGVLDTLELRPHKVIIEVPRFYPHKHTGDTNDLIDLAVRVGELKRHHQANNADVQLVYPRTWKGTIPKTIHNKRVLSKLSPEEIKLLPKRPRAKNYDHNMLDAVGIGLWKLGRMYG